MSGGDVWKTAREIAEIGGLSNARVRQVLDKVDIESRKKSDWGRKGKVPNEFKLTPELVPLFLKDKSPDNTRKVNISLFGEGTENLEEIVNGSSSNEVIDGVYAPPRVEVSECKVQTHLDFSISPKAHYSYEAMRDVFVRVEPFLFSSNEAYEMLWKRISPEGKDVPGGVVLKKAAEASDAIFLRDGNWEYLAAVAEINVDSVRKLLDPREGKLAKYVKAFAPGVYYVKPSQIQDIVKEMRIDEYGAKQASEMFGYKIEPAPKVRKMPARVVSPEPAAVAEISGDGSTVFNINNNGFEIDERAEYRCRDVWDMLRLVHSGVFNDRTMTPVFECMGVSDTWNLSHRSSRVLGSLVAQYFTRLGSGIVIYGSSSAKKKIAPKLGIGDNEVGAALKRPECQPYIRSGEELGIDQEYILRDDISKMKEALGTVAPGALRQ